MALTLKSILNNRAFNLSLVTPDVTEEILATPVIWVHSSDLEDPTPFLDRGQLLLTDGTQFPVADSAEALFSEYVERLVRHGISGLGFATQVIHGALPQGLVAACRRHGLPLFEVPDRTPFIAIIRFVADWLSKEQHARSEWSLQAHRAIARAALRPDGLRSIMAELERQIQGWVALFDAAGNHILMPNNRPIPSSLLPGVAEAVRKSLELGSWSAQHLQVHDEQIALQTLGRRHRLRGVLVLGSIEPLNPARTDISNSVIAMASLALEQTRNLDAARRLLRSGVFEQMLAGSMDVAERTARQVWGKLPSDPLLVNAVQPTGHGQNLMEALELLADDHRGGVFYAQRNEVIVVLTGKALQPKVAQLLDRYDAITEVSSERKIADLQRGLKEAEQSLQRAVELGLPVMTFEDISKGGMLGLLRGWAPVSSPAFMR